MSDYPITDPAVLALKGISRALSQDADDARSNGALIEPVALDHHAAMLDKARDTLEFEHAQRLTNDDTVWLKTVMRSLARCVEGAERTGSTISASEIRAVISVVNDAKAQGGAE